MFTKRFFLADAFRLRKIATDHHILTHVNVECLDYRCPELKIYVSELILGSYEYSYTPPISVAARSKAWVYGRSLAGTVGSNLAGGHGCLSVLSIVCCQIDVSATQ